SPSHDNTPTTMVVSGLTAVLAAGVTVTAESGTVASIGVGATGELTDVVASERTLGVTEVPALTTGVDDGSTAGLGGRAELDPDGAEANGVDPSPALLSAESEPNESVVLAP